MSIPKSVLSVGNSFLSPEGFTSASGMLYSMGAPHAHNEIEFSLILDGSQVGLIGGKTCKQSRKDIILFWAAVPHRPLKVNRPGRFALVQIPLPWFMRCRVPARFTESLLDGNVICEPSEDLESDARMFLRWQTDLQSKDPERRDIARSEVEVRLRRLAIEHVHANHDELQTHFDRDATIVMARFIGEHFQDELSVDRIAAAAGLSANYAAKMFRRVWHMSPTAFANRYRLIEAQRLLATTNYKIIDIIERSGFRSVSQFYCEFRKAFGYSPRACRETLTESKSAKH